MPSETSASDGTSSIRIGTRSSFSRIWGGSSASVCSAICSTSSSADHQGAGPGGEVEPADLLPRGDHRSAVAGELVDAAERVLRIGVERLIALGDLDPAPGRIGILGRQRELGEVEGELAVVDHELASSASAVRASAGSPRATSACALM